MWRLSYRAKPFEGYITLSPEKISKADPERIILIDTPDGASETLKTEDFWEKLSAVKQNQVHNFDYYGLINPGSIASIETACQKLKNLLTDQS
ncbi:MAG: ABC transporter substrate-binding protein [Synechococcales cyanobacterium CRU_2_2]|nr:ABC transporter substrate-binding protein [Synechococcales cyanobacterium CRU_2_2]